MKRTSCSWRLVRIAARSPACARTSPDVEHNVRPHFTRNDVGNGRLPEPWRTIKNRMIERLSSAVSPLRCRSAGIPSCALARCTRRGSADAAPVSMLRSSSVNCALTTRWDHNGSGLSGVSSLFRGRRNVFGRRRQGALAGSRHSYRNPAGRLSRLGSDREDSAPSAPIDIATDVPRLGFRNELARTSFRFHDIPPGRTRRPAACSPPAGHTGRASDRPLYKSQAIGHAGCGIAIGTFPAGLADAFRLCGRLFSRPATSEPQ